MNELRKAAEMALEVMEYNRANGAPNMGAAIEALRKALAQPEQEPAAWQDPQYKTLIEPHKAHPDWIPLYTASPKREWHGLTDEEILSDGDSIVWSEEGIRYFARAIEAKLKEKNL